jgi:peptidyl-prolyl cis-trans isomerase SurA
MMLKNCYSKRWVPRIDWRRPMLGTLAATAMLMLTKVQAQTLFSYGKHTASKEEFIRSFDKNAPSTDKRKAMVEYLPLFINYKLKVQAARDEKMDTLPSQKADLEVYKQQLQDGFLMQRSNVNQITDEAILRSQTDILLGHLFFPFTAQDSNSLSSANTKAQAAYASVKSGQSFEKAANNNNVADQPVDGKVGWITAFSLPYKFETAVYALKDGDITQPIQGSTGFHIFKRMASREAVGRIQVAQILLWLPENASKVDIVVKEQLADSIYKTLMQGTSFEDLALQYSNDRTSYATGGQLPEFGVGEFDEGFETAAFALKAPGDITKPFRTSFGIHLLKLLKKTTAASEDSLEYLERVRQQVLASGRQEMAKENYLKAMLPKMGFKVAPFNKSQLWQYTDSALKNTTAPGNPISKASLLFSFTNEKVLAENWILYLRGVQRPANTDATAYQTIWDQYVLQSAEDHYKRNVQRYEPGFNEQFNEFKEANLLFQAMDTHVWTAANNDSTGLKKHYEANQSKYTWQEGVTALSMASYDSVLLVYYTKTISGTPLQWKQIAETYGQRLLADSGRFEMTQIPLDQMQQPLQPGALSKIVRNQADNSFSCIYVFEIKNGGDTRGFEEAKGWVISDYQQVLEKQWVEKLKRKYPVKINEAVWQQVLKVK